MKRQIILFLSLFIFILSSNVFAISSKENEWRSYIDGTIGKPIYYLHQQVMDGFFHAKKNYRAFDFGSGAGNEDIDLIKRGWDVSGIDFSSRSKDVIEQRAKYLPGHFTFQQGDFSVVRMSGYYDLVMSYFSLPFGNKNDLGILLNNISRHMQVGAVFAVNFFGNLHDFVKKGDAYGMTQDELFNLLSSNHFKVDFFLNRVYDQRDFAGHEVHWDVFDVIAIKA